MSKPAGMAPFWERFSDIAARETRVVILPEAEGGLPADAYGFLELYCDAPTCDCRRVLLQVRTEAKPDTILATINYGWESEAFYTRWMHGDRKAAHEIRDASLDPLNPQSEFAPFLLNLFQDVVLADPAYIARLGRHYAMFKDGSRPPGAAHDRQAPTRQMKNVPAVHDLWRQPEPIRGVLSMTNPTASDPSEFWKNQAVLQKEQEIYSAVRKKLQSFHPDINKRANRAEMEDVARKLDILRQGIFCFDSEEHTAIFSDYLMHFSRLHGTTPCERYLKSVDRRAADEITQRAYAALTGVRYTVLRMDESITGFGVLCHDCFLGTRVFLMDRSLSQMPAGQIALATGVFPVKEWFTTTGAALPLPAKDLDVTLGELFKLAGLKFMPPVTLSPDDNSRLVLKVIRTINATGMVENVRYQ